MFSRFFIDRPIFAAVLSIFIVIAGLAAMRVLPIAQYPEIAPPVVTVQAVYPGASAEVIEQTVAAPIENAITGIEKMIFMSSTSGSNGIVQIQVTFDIGTNPDQATVDVNNRVKQAEARLPEEVRRQGVTVQKGSSAFLQVLAFYSPEGRYDNLAISNYVTLNVLDALKRVPGTTNVQIFGAKDYAMRIWVRPDRLTQLRLTPNDLIRAVGEQNAQFAAGKIGQEPIRGTQELVYTITTKGRLADVREFENIIVRSNPDGSNLRLKDVARVELASKDYEFIGRLNGTQTTLIGVFLLPGANALKVAEDVVKTVDEIKPRFPPGMVYSVPYDTTRFVKVSIEEVVKTLAIAIVLVVLVVFLFLQNWRATLIPMAAVPVSLIGTFAGLYMLGYSINTLTLFGMVLAIGIVVDDAIVVLENIERIMHEEQGFYIAAVILPDGATLERTDKVVAKVMEAIKSNPNNQDAVAFTGFDFLGGYFRNNAATIFVTQIPWDERKVDTKQLVGELFMKTAGIKEGLVLAFGPPAIFGLGTAGGFELYLQNRGEGGAQRLAQVMGAYMQRAAQDRTFALVQTLWRASTPQLYVDVDREKAKALGVPLGDLYSALAATLGSYYVNDFNKYGRTWQVLMSAEAQYRNNPGDVGDIYVRSERGEMVPIRALANVRYASGPDSMTRFNNLPAVKLFGQAAPGVSSGQAIAEAEKLAAEVLPPDFSYDWGGASYQEKKSGGTSVIALGLAVIMVFLILAAQYERWSLPLSVLLALPFGTFGALAAVWLRGLTNDVYFQIGLVTLLGLAAKNAILIVEYAVLKHEEGLSASAAAVEAARLRFRPILMTSLAFILGVLPLAFSHGAGAGARLSVGTGVMGGMLAATFLAIFFIPLFYRAIVDRRLTESRS